MRYRKEGQLRRHLASPRPHGEAAPARTNATDVSISGRRQRESAKGGGQNVPVTLGREEGAVPPLGLFRYLDERTYLQRACGTP